MCIIQYTIYIIKLYNVRCILNIGISNDNSYWSIGIPKHIELYNVNNRNLNNGINTPYME